MRQDSLCVSFGHFEKQTQTGFSVRLCCVAEGVEFSSLLAWLSLAPDFVNGQAALRFKDAEDFALQSACGKKCGDVGQ